MNLTRQQLCVFQRIFETEKKKSCQCMYEDCTEKAIGSHVFSRSHILAPISDLRNEIYVFEQRPLAYINEGVLRYKSRSINNVFKFNGFCSKHDNDLFRDIEPAEGCVEWSNIRFQYLLSYRTLCREIYANNVIQKTFGKYISKYKDEANMCYYLLLFNEKLAQMERTKDTLMYYKDFLERGIDSCDYSDLSFEYIELPFQLDLCVAAPVHVNDNQGACFNADYQEINIVNVFPYYGKTIIIIGYSKVFDNVWLNELLPKLKSPFPHIVSSAFTDILYRAEFHAMSFALYHSLDKDLLTYFLNSWLSEADNFSNDIEEVSSLFYLPLKEIMPESWKTL